MIAKGVREERVSAVCKMQPCSVLKVWLSKRSRGAALMEHLIFGIRDGIRLGLAFGSRS